jgi:segregation and condensation protein B
MNLSEESENGLGQPWQLDVEPMEAIPGSWEQAGNSAPASEQDTCVDASLPLLPHIVEGLLFAADEPVTAETMCQIIRGLTGEQFAETIHQLNREYRQQARPYRIDRENIGYCLRLHHRFKGALEKLYGGLREARFNSASVEILAVIAYRQPISKAAIDAIRGQESDGPLRQLMRRGLVIHQGKDDRGQTCFAVSPRFLKFFQLNRLDELPRADDLERI